MFSGVVQVTLAFVCRATRTTSMSARKTLTAGEAIKMLDSPVLWNGRIGYSCIAVIHKLISIFSICQMARCRLLLHTISGEITSCTLSSSHVLDLIVALLTNLYHFMVSLGSSVHLDTCCPERTGFPSAGRPSCPTPLYPPLFVPSLVTPLLTSLLTCDCLLPSLCPPQVRYGPVPAPLPRHRRLRQRQ
jgi:hypothetical protein